MEPVSYGIISQLMGLSTSSGALDGPKDADKVAGELYNSIVRAVENATSSTNEDDVVATDEAISKCPELLSFTHYSSLPAVNAIMATGNILASPSNGGIYFSDAQYGPVTVWNELFIGSPYFIDKAKGFVEIMVDCTVPIIFSEKHEHMSEFFHVGRLRRTPEIVEFVMAGPNLFPEASAYEGIELP